MKGKDIAYVAATLAVGFVAFKVYRTASTAIDAGASVAESIVSGAKKVIAEDLNPASDKNIVYGGVTKVVQAATGRDETLGTWLYSIFNADPNSPDANKQYVAPRPANYDAYDFQNVTTSNPPTVTVESPQTAFRLSELNAVYETKFDKFLKTISGQ